jgi:hypothetical protein
MFNVKKMSRYSGALTIIRLNGSKEIGQTNNIKTKELPKWEQRLNKRINNIRRDLGRITQYLKGINSNHLIVIFILSARRECFLCMKRSFTPRRRSRQYKPLNAQKHLRARNINNIFSIIDSKN